ncbi:MAG: TIGR00282 family metallophosphoesterase [Clostridia bacterium]|nr:TIGR00282 family metallophosphoesterase [Clostridia bacterium]
MRFLLIGDVVGTGGVEFLQRHLNSLKKLKCIDFVVANAENSSKNGKGISHDAAHSMYNCGVDVFTMGNHTFDNYDIFGLFEDNFPVIRPANIPPGNEGEGYLTIDISGIKITVINLLGRVFMNNIDCPFRTVSNIIDKIKSESDIIIVDFHAEATSEKLAMGFFLDGKVSAVFGTHTHIPTADERILQSGTGYITDIGMTGCPNSILGIKKDIIIKKFITAAPQRHEVDNENVELNGLILDIDEKTGKTTHIERISLS